MSSCKSDDTIPSHLRWYGVRYQCASADHGSQMIDRTIALVVFAVVLVVVAGSTFFFFHRRAVLELHTRARGANQRRASAFACCGSSAMASRHSIRHVGLRCRRQAQTNERAILFERYAIIQRQETTMTRELSRDNLSVAPTGSNAQCPRK